MHLTCSKHSDLTREEWNEISTYRRRVFVDWIGWHLPLRGGMEQDEFDQSWTVHVVARDSDDGIVGYCRILPTTAPYLLAGLFSNSLRVEAPHSRQIWEISRYSAVNVSCEDARDFASDETTGKALLLAAIRYAATAGATSLVYCSTLAIERLARRWGVEALRLGPPRRCPAGWLVAGEILLSAATYSALGAVPGDGPVAADRTVDIELPMSSALDARLSSARKAGCPGGRGSVSPTFL